MYILYIVPYMPTLIRTRPYNLLRGLARRGHTVTLATLWESEQERAALEHLDNEGIRVLAAKLTKTRSVFNSLRNLPSSTPLQANYCWQPELMNSVQSSVVSSQTKYDLIHVEHLRGARYGLHLKSVPCDLRPVPPIIWDSVDCISHLFEQAAHHSRSPLSRMITRLELGRTRRYEAWLVNQFDRVLVTSAVDAEALETLVTSTKSQAARFQNPESNLRPTTCDLPATCDLRPATITVLPNGVDLNYFTPADTPREPETIVFTGKLSYHANVTAALHLVNDIMPRVWKERPDVRVQIVGQNPTSEIRRLNTDHRILITGSVPDLRPYLQPATVAVAPMSYGAGIQNKVLEAMACATPVVATAQAVSALQARDGDELLVGDGAEDFARKVLELLANAELRERIGKAGRRYVEQCHDWDRIVERLDQVYRTVVG